MDRPTTNHGLVAQAQRIADDILFPAANDVDLAGEIPRAQLQAIVDAGIYGLTGPAELGGAAANEPTLLAVIEALASGCLSTCFVWVQHQGATRAVATAEGPVHTTWARQLATGESRSGVAFAHLLRTGPPAIVAEPTTDGWLFSGTAPWVTGWGYIDVFHVAARQGDDIVWALLDGREAKTLRSRQLHLAAIDSSATYQIDFDQHPVDIDRLTLMEPYDEWHARYPSGLRVNGSLSLGVARRAAELLGSTEANAELDDARAQLDEADIDRLPEARGRVSAVAVRLTSKLVASHGGRSIVRDNHGQRLAREALFLLIQGQTPEIREAQLRYL